MEEKGQIIDDFLDGNLRRVTINPYGKAVDRPPASPPPVTTRPAPTNAEYWAGTVLATSTEIGRFRVRLEADGKPAYEVDFPMTRLAPDALSHLRVGAQVELEISAFDENASRTIDSTLTLTPAPAPDRAAREAARQRALQRRQQVT